MLNKRQTFSFALALTLLLGAAPPPATAQSKEPPPTFFDHLENAWAVGKLRLLRPLHYRNGQVLAYPARIVELTYARRGAPRNVLLVIELPSKDAPHPFEADDEVYAAITILPRYAFWRDNLPNTPRHGILGGLRYAFRGDDIEKVQAVAKAYTDTLSQGMPERTVNQITVIVDALFSDVATLREDAVAHLARYPLLARDLSEPAAARLAKFIGGDFPQEERIELISAVGAGGVSALVPLLETLTGHDDAVAAAALAALDSLDHPRSTDRLIELTAAKSDEVRSYAYRALGKRAKEDKRALDAATAVLTADEDASVRAAAASGLGDSTSERAIPSLRDALYRGDDASRAAAEALAAIGRPEAVDVLRKAVTDAPHNGMVGAVVALVGIREKCSECVHRLVELHDTHPDKGIRDLIGVVLGLDEGTAESAGAGGDASH